MKNIKFFISAFILIAVYQSCAQYTYFPQVPHTPVSENKELDIACTELFSLTGWQISYSPINKLSLGFAADYGIRIPHAGFETGVG